MSPRGMISFIPVSDLVRSVAFYGDHVGATVCITQPGVVILRISPNAYLGLVQHAAPVAAERRIIIAFVVEDVAAAYQHMIAAGCVVDAAPRISERYQIEHFFADDPDGHRLEVQRFLHPFD
jgi:hypothetical protein